MEPVKAGVAQYQVLIVVRLLSDTQLSGLVLYNEQMGIILAIYTFYLLGYKCSLLVWQFKPQKINLACLYHGSLKVRQSSVHANPALPAWVQPGLLCGQLSLSIIYAVHVPWK